MAKLSQIVSGSRCLGTLGQKAVVETDQLGQVADGNAFVGAVKARQVLRPCPHGRELEDVVADLAKVDGI